MNRTTPSVSTPFAPLLLALLVGCASGGPTNPPAQSSPKTPALPSTDKATGFALTVVEGAESEQAKALVDEFRSTLATIWTPLDAIPASEAQVLRVMADRSITRLLRIGVSVEATDTALSMRAAVECCVPGSQEVITRDAPGAGEPQHRARDLAYDLVRAVRFEHAKRDDIAASLESVERPVRDRLAVARTQQQRGDVLAALRQTDLALQAANEIKAATLTNEVNTYRATLAEPLKDHVIRLADGPDVVACLRALGLLRTITPAERAAEVDQLRAQVVPKAITALGKAIDEGKAEDAVSIHAALEPLAQDRAADVEPLAGRLQELRRTTAAGLTRQAGALPATRYQEAGRLLRRALDLDPESAEAQRLLQTVEAKARELRPSYVADVHVAKDGDGFRIEFSLKTQDGKLTAAEGQARVRLVLAAKQRHATVVQRLFDSSYDVPVDAFARVTRSALGVKTPRIARRDVAKFGMAEIGSRGFAQLLIEHDLVLLAIIDYTPTGGERVTITEEINPFSF